MDDSQYDEFGNYIGNDEEDDALGANFIDRGKGDDDAFSAPMEVDVGDNGNLQLTSMESGDIYERSQIILHEDKKYYPTAQEVFGVDVDTTVQEEDTMALSEPIIVPINVKKFQMNEKSIPETTYDKEFLLSLLKFPAQCRNIGIVGHLHHGKTSVLDMLVKSTHPNVQAKGKNESIKYTDVHLLERDRQCSIKAMPISLVLPTSRSKSFAFNFYDTPGHGDFSDEVTAALRISDGAVLVVDAVEGVMCHTERLIKHMCSEGVPFVLVLNKVDRLILELKIPPNDAYFKLRHTIEEVNSILSSCSNRPYRLSPELGNVIFASATMGWSFTLLSFAKKYEKTYQCNFDTKAFSKRLWGDMYYDNNSRKFVRKPAVEGTTRSFVHFVLEPLYKIYSQILGETDIDLQKFLQNLGCNYKLQDLKMDVKPLLGHILGQFLGSTTAIVDVLVDQLPSPLDNNKKKVEHTYSGPLDTDTCRDMFRCSSNGKLMVQIVKNYNTLDTINFESYGRILSGTIRVGQKVIVLGEKFSSDNDEDMATATVSDLWVYQSRYHIPISEASAGMWVLIGGLGSIISKTATITDNSNEEPFVFRPLKFNTSPIFKVAIEPLDPSQLPKMLDGLRKVNKTFLILKTRVEESGEHVVLGTGELYLDCVLHDLRKVFADIDVKVSDPVVTFSETVAETSAIQCFAETPNKRNKITMIAEPLEKGIAEDIEQGLITLDHSKKEISNFFREKYGWDMMDANNIIAFGPDKNGPNVLIDGTIPGETSKEDLRSILESLKQGFDWATREGPLCDEPIRNVKFRIIRVSTDKETVYRGPGQIIPTSRRVCYSSFLTASPRIMEPVYCVEIQSPADCVSAVYTVLQRRRGHITKDLPKPGTPLHTIQAYIPVIDSFGFETDLRTHTQGQAFCQQVFDHWQIVSGDPMDKSIILKPLEPSSPQVLARDFMIKTRRRKGLSEDVSISKFFDDPMLLKLANEQVLRV